MALLAEEIVEEWLNRNGHFTIRGAKVGLYEIDLLAIKKNGSKIERRHIEVQASIRPVSYITPIPKQVQRKLGRAPFNASKRNADELKASVKEWVHKKFLMPEKCVLRESLYPGKWQYELVVNEVRHPDELPFIEKEGIKIIRLSGIVEQLRSSKTCIKSAAGRDLVELVMLETKQSNSTAAGLMCSIR